MHAVAVGRRWFALIAASSIQRDGCQGECVRERPSFEAGVVRRIDTPRTVADFGDGLFSQSVAFSPLWVMNLS